MGLWKLFQRLRRCLQAGDLDVTYLVGEKKSLRKKKELFSSEEKQKKSGGLEGKTINSYEK